ncbi:MAG: NAD-dependent epimerase/dehydratase family protein [Acidobacteriota bacterium]|nr:NAD-dependent epimerase/dehydratase family protein [Acidobacteriota bacterium]
MRVVIIGGSGHIGSYLTPRLVELGHETVCVSRWLREPYVAHGAWKKVERVTLDRGPEEAAGTFGAKIRSLEPDAVIDITAYTLESTVQLVEALRGRVGHFLHCGTIWVHGPSVEVPVTEEQPRRPFGEYGIRKAAIEAYLLREARLNGFPATVLHPRHIVGVGWIPLNPAANFNFGVFEDLAAGREVVLPNLGRETVHHVHADDVAQAFVKAMANRANALGESFHVVSPAAVSLAGYAEAVAGWFGEKARIRYLPWEEWRGTVDEKDALKTWDHIARSPCCGIGKARRMIDYEPRYRSLEAIREAVMWWFERKA